MKHFYATVLAVFMLLSGTMSFAQVSVGTGYIFATDWVRQHSETLTGMDHNGIYVGAQYDVRVPFVSGLGVSSGLYANYLFSKNREEFGSPYLGGYHRFTEISLSIPIQATFGFDSSSRINLFAFAGPTIQYGIICKTIHTDVNDNSPVTCNHYTGDDPDRNRFNVLLGCGLGLRVSRFKVIVGIDQALTDYGVDRSLLKINVDDSTVGSRTQLKMGVGYAF